MQFRKRYNQLFSTALQACKKSVIYRYRAHCWWHRCYSVGLLVSRWCYQRQKIVGSRDITQTYGVTCCVVALYTGTCDEYTAAFRRTKASVPSWAICSALVELHWAEAGDTWYVCVWQQFDLSRATTARKNAPRHVRAPWNTFSARCIGVYYRYGGHRRVFVVDFTCGFARIKSTIRDAGRRLCARRQIIIWRSLVSYKLTTMTCRRRCPTLPHTASSSFSRAGGGRAKLR